MACLERIEPSHLLRREDGAQFSLYALVHRPYAWVALAQNGIQLGTKPLKNGLSLALLDCRKTKVLKLTR
jgi:hypothetical protein